MGQMPSTISCVGGTATPAGDKWGNPVYLGPVNAQWSWGVQCGQGVTGGTVSNTSNSQSLYTCAVSCDQNALCVAAGYTGTQCVQYSDLTGATQIDATNTILLTTDSTHSGSQCQEGSYDGYDILCGVDYTGGDLSTTQATSFKDCIATCDATSACVDVSYNQGTCNLKQSVGTPQQNANVWNAKKQGVTALSIVSSLLTTSASSSSSSSIITTILSTTASPTTPISSPTTAIPTTTTTTSTTATSSSAVPTPLSCNNNRSNGTIYDGFEIACGADYYGGDMGSLSTPTFEQCIDTCANTTGCIVLAYNGNMCYMKNVMNPPNSNIAVWGAKIARVSVSSTSSSTTQAPTTTPTTQAPTTQAPTTQAPTTQAPTTQAPTTQAPTTQAPTTQAPTTQAPTTQAPTTQIQTSTPTSSSTQTQTTTQTLSAAQIQGTCAPGYYNTQNSSYTIVCDATFYGGDLSSQSTDTFAACIAACDATQACVDVSYVGNMCYLKQQLTALRSETGTKTAVRAALVNSTITTDPTCNNDASDGKTYNTAAGNAFTIVCGTDYRGGDLSSVNGVTFQTCIDQCGATSGCVGVAYRGNSCYLKNALSTGVQDDGVWGAKFANSAPLS